MYNVTMKKLIGGHNVRTDTVTGTCDSYPIVGESFAMLAESLSFQGGIRLVSTSIVNAITETSTGNFTIETQNSTYQLVIS